MILCGHSGIRSGYAARDLAVWRDCLGRRFALSLSSPLPACVITCVSFPLSLKFYYGWTSLASTSWPCSWWGPGCSWTSCSARRRRASRASGGRRGNCFGLCSFCVCSSRSWPAFSASRSPSFVLICVGFRFSAFCCSFLSVLLGCVPLRLLSFPSHVVLLLVFVFRLVVSLRIFSCYRVSVCSALFFALPCSRC